MICTICDGVFDPETEGGHAGFIGILPVQFCPTCHAGIMDYADQFKIFEEEVLTSSTGSLE